MSPLRGSCDVSYIFYNPITPSGFGRCMTYFSIIISPLRGFSRQSRRDDKIIATRLFTTQPRRGDMIIEMATTPNPNPEGVS